VIPRRQAFVAIIIVGHMIITPIIGDFKEFPGTPDYGVIDTV
jgi:hypothetical protein